MRLDSNFCFSTSFIAEKTSKRSTVEQSIGIFFQWLCFLLDLSFNGSIFALLWRYVAMG
jgi:hypothetical protein